jgi:hypothetical protein
MEQNPSWESRYSAFFMKPEGSLLCSQGPAKRREGEGRQVICWKGVL